MTSNKANKYNSCTNTQWMITYCLSGVSSQGSHRFRGEGHILYEDPHYNNICMPTIDDYLLVLSFSCVITRQP